MDFRDKFIQPKMNSSTRQILVDANKKEYIFDSQLGSVGNMVIILELIDAKQKWQTRLTGCQLVSQIEYINEKVNNPKTYSFLFLFHFMDIIKKYEHPLDGCSYSSFLAEAKGFEPLWAVAPRK